jgi:hypothetical protein
MANIGGQQELAPGLTLFDGVLDVAWQVKLVAEVDSWVAAGTVSSPFFHWSRFGSRYDGGMRSTRAAYRTTLRS